MASSEDHVKAWNGYGSSRLLLFVVATSLSLLAIFVSDSKSVVGRSAAGHAAVPSTSRKAEETENTMGADGRIQLKHDETAQVTGAERPTNYDNPRFLITGIAAGRGTVAALDIRSGVSDTFAEQQLQLLLQLAEDLPGNRGHHVHVVGREDQYLLAMRKMGSSGVDSHRCLTHVDHGNGNVSDVDIRGEEGHPHHVSPPSASFVLPPNPHSSSSPSKLPPTCSFRFDSEAVRQTKGRTNRLGVARNQYLEVAARNDFDFMIVIDLDVTCSAVRYNATVVSQLLHLRNFSALSFLAPNGPDTPVAQFDADHLYWDLYALEPPGSRQQMTSKITAVRQWLHDENTHTQVGPPGSQSLLDATAQKLRVRSAFMTIAVYRVASFAAAASNMATAPATVAGGSQERDALRCRYAGTVLPEHTNSQRSRRPAFGQTVCEHKPFHFCLEDSNAPQQAIFPCIPCQALGVRYPYYDFCPAALSVGS